LDHGDWDGRSDEEVLVRVFKVLLMVGRVRLAKNVNTGQLAAVKIVPKSLTPTARKKEDKGKKADDKVGDPGLSYSIEREVVIMKLIEHPNVMSLYDVWENRGELYNHPRRR
jgi:serine/threonine-protein kinase HSL1, negative regulator of Swe1 kinase